MKTPSNIDQFRNIVIEKFKIYCDTNIWPFKFDKITAWLGNFDCEVEEYIALQILDNLVVRTNEMAKASYSRLLHGSLRQHLNYYTSVKTSSISQWKQILKQGLLHRKLGFFPAKRHGDKGDSSEIIYRMLSEDINTNKYSQHSLSSNFEVIILVDDFIGSGKQFIDFANEIKLAEILKFSHVIYCPLIAYEIGRTLIEESYPELHILPAEYIFESDSLFSGDENSLFKNDLENTVGTVKAKFKQMHKKYASSMPNWFGYEDAALPLAFEWGCPNQTPSILYMEYSKSMQHWSQLFSRRS